MSQKNTVRDAINANIKNGSLDRKAAQSYIFEKLKSGELVTGKNPDTFWQYAGSLLTNWLRRDPTLNGSAGISKKSKKAPVDEELKRLFTAKAMLVSNNLSTTDIDALINARSEDVKADKDNSKVLLENQVAKLLEDL